MDPKPTLGIVGLGIMGRPMARNLMQAGYPLVVHDLTRAVVDELVGEGATVGTSPWEPYRLAVVELRVARGRDLPSGDPGRVRVVELVPHADCRPDERCHGGLVALRCPGRLAQAGAVDEREGRADEPVVDAIGREPRGQLGGMRREVVRRVGPVGGHQGCTRGRSTDTSPASGAAGRAPCPHLVVLDDDVEHDDDDDNGDEQEGSDLTGPTIVVGRSPLITHTGHAGGPGRGPGPRARG